MKKENEKLASIGGLEGGVGRPPKEVKNTFVTVVKVFRPYLH